MRSMLGPRGLLEPPGLYRLRQRSVGRRLERPDTHASRLLRGSDILRSLLPVADGCKAISP